MAPHECVGDDVKRYDIEDLSGARTLLVASTGGHLTQLSRLAPRLGVSPDSIWLTFDTPQSRALLAGQRVHYVPYVAPRDFKGIVRASGLARHLLSQVDATVSTGAGLALSVLPEMLLRRKPTVYIESVSRVDGPSITGRLLSRLPGIGLYCQHELWAESPWRVGPSVLGDYQTSEAPVAELPHRILVTLGTIGPYRFDRMIDAVLAHQRQYPEVEVLWQVGCTDRSDLPGRVVEQLNADEFNEAITWADAVVAHSGVGVCLNILDHGKVPLLMARRRDLGEHVDDHQFQILRYLTERGLAADAAELLTSPTDMARAASMRVGRVEQAA